MLSTAALQLVKVVLTLEARDLAEVKEMVLNSKSKLLEYDKDPDISRLGATVYHASFVVLCDSMDDPKLMVYAFLREHCPEFFEILGYARFNLVVWDDPGAVQWAVGLGNKIMAEGAR